MKSVLISAVDKLIIKIWKKITAGNFNNGICNDFSSLVNTLKAEAQGIGYEEVTNNLITISSRIDQNKLQQTNSLYNICCDTLAILIEQYIKIIDAK